MTNQVETIMALADEYLLAQTKYGVFAEEVGKVKDELRQALEAALKPGEPIKFLANATRFKMSFFQNEDGEGNQTAGTHVTCFEAFEDELDGRWVALVPAEDDCHIKRTAPPAQTPTKGLFIDLIAQHPGLAEELKAIDDAPMPTWTPPPRLTTKQHNELWNSYLSGKGGGTTYSEFLETAVRRQFLGDRDE